MLRGVSGLVRAAVVRVLVRISLLTDSSCICCARSKESANCRLELNYAQQNEDVDMIPLMMEANYRPKVSGTRVQSPAATQP